jgi:hypothetical protein
VKPYARRLFIIAAILALAGGAFLCALFAVSSSLNYCVEHPESVCCQKNVLCTGAEPFPNEIPASNIPWLIVIGVAVLFAGWLMFEGEEE